MEAKKISIDHLIDSYMEAVTGDSESLDEALRDHGYNPGHLETRALLKIKQLRFQQTVQSKKTAFGDLYAKAITLLKEVKQDSKEAIFNALRAKSPTLQFNNLEKLDVENLRAILTDTEILDLIDQIEKGQVK